MIFNSIRWRVQIWHGVILVVVLAAFGVMAYQVAWDRQLRQIDRELELQLERLVRPRPDFEMEPPGDQGRPDFSHGPHEPAPPGFGPGPGPNGPPNRDFWRSRVRDQLKQLQAADAGGGSPYYFVAWNEDGSELARSTNAPMAVPATRFTATPTDARRPDEDDLHGFPGPGRFQFRTRADFRELLRETPSGLVVLAGRSIASDQAGMRGLAFWFVSAGAGVLLLGLVGGWWLASRAIQPVEVISATAGKIADGDLSQRINVADTDSELGRLASVLNSTFARLEAAFANQARFTSDASHELRTPVSVIITHTQSALARQRSADEYREALEACQRSAQRMRKLTQSLLELARLDAGQEDVEHEPFDLAAAARESLELIRPLADKRELKIQCELEPAHCMGDAARTGVVINNLLTNAVHYNRDGGEIRISTRIENGVGVLTVADTGEGIDPEDLPHIFKRFYRGDKARSGIQGNAGLGLAICKAILDASHGTIEVSSRPGEGSTFVVRLPSV